MNSVITEYRFQGFRLDVSKHSLYGPDGEIRPLSGRALDILKLLIEHRGELLSKAYLLEHVWPDAYVEENNLTQAITNIRKVLGDSKDDSRFIKTLIRRGYCFVAELDEVADGIPASAAPASPAAVTPSGGGRGNGPAVPLDRNPAESAGTDDTADDSPAIRIHTEFPLSYALAFLAVITCILVAGLYFYANRAQVPTATVADAGTSAASPARAVIPGSVAVLPFTNLTPGENDKDDIFALGLHDELINQLSRINSLKLVSRESVLAPALQRMTLPEIGRLLNVESVITGTLLYSDQETRIKLQMLDPESGIIKWAFEHDADTDSLDDMIETQNNIATKVATALQADFVSELPLSMTDAQSTTSFEAYRYNMAARRAYYNQHFAKSLALSKQALALDPDYPGALYNFSKAHYYLSSSPLPGMTTSEHLAQGLESAQRLIELAPDKHEGYVLKATALGSSRRWNEAMREVKRLQDMEAPLWDQQLLVPILMSLGEYGRTIEILEANLQVEPLNSYGRGFLMAAYEAVGNHVRARLEYDMGEELTPDWWGDTVNFFLLLGRGEIPADLATFQGTPDEVKALLAKIRSGDGDAARDDLNAALQVEPPSSSRYVHYAAVAAYLDEQELAIRFMQKATDILPVHLHWIWQPVFRKTWQQPEFRTLLESSGVLAYWQKHGPPDICNTDSELFVCDREKLASN